MFDRLELWKEQKRKLKLKYDDIAALSNIPKGTIQNIFAGYIDNPRIDTVQAIERALGLSEWSAEESRTSTSSKSKGKWINVYGSIAAGIPIEAIEDIIGQEEITAEMAARGEYIALKVKGNSMAPRIMDGDVVIIRLQESVENNEIAAVFVNGDECTLKKIKKEDNGLWLEPLNTAYQPIFYSKKQCAELPVRILGKMVELRAKF